MGADQDVHLALLEVLERLRGSAWPTGSATPSRSGTGSRAGARVKVPKCCWASTVVGTRNITCLRVGGGLERRAQRHLGLAVAHVAADQAVHRARLLHVGPHGLDRLQLVGGLAEGERRLELELPLAVAREGVAGAALALGVEVDQLAGQRLGRAAGAQLLLLPLLAAELGQRRVAGVGAHVAADLVELVRGHEHPVAVAELELQVVARDAADGLGLEAREQADAVVLVHHRRAGAQVGEAGHRAGARARAGRALGAAAAQQPVLGDDRQLQLRGEEALAQARPRRTTGPAPCGAGLPSRNAALIRSRL